VLCEWRQIFIFLFFFLVRVRRFEIKTERFFVLNISAILLFLILTVNPSVAFLNLLLTLRLITSAVNSCYRVLFLPGFKNIIDDGRCLDPTIKFSLYWSRRYTVAVLPSIDCGLWCLIFTKILFLLLFANVWLLWVWKNFAFVCALDHAVGLAHLLLNAALL